jgi:hypothetical protein
MEAVGALLRQGHRYLDGYRAGGLATGQNGRQILAGQVLHADEVVAVDLTQLERGDDIRVLESSGDPRLVEEHRAKVLAVSQMRQDPLERDDLAEALDPDLLGDVEAAHSPLAENSAQSISAEPLAFAGSAARLLLGGLVRHENDSPARQYTTTALSFTRSIAFHARKRPCFAVLSLRVAEALSALPTS